MRTALVPLTLAAAGLAACAGTPPQLEVTDAYVAQRSPQASVVHVRVKASNPTPEPLAMWAVAYDSDAADQVGRWTQATAPAGGSVTFDLPVVTTPDVPAQLNLRGSVSYVPGGRFRELLGELGVGLPSTTFGGSVSVAQNAPSQAPLRPGQVRTALVTEPAPLKAIDTLPPLKP